MTGWFSVFLSVDARTGELSRQKIEARLKLWNERWQNREFELEGVQAAPDSEGQSMLQLELVTALLNGKNWSLTDIEKKAWPPTASTGPA